MIAELFFVFWTSVAEQAFPIMSNYQRANMMNRSFFSMSVVVVYLFCNAVDEVASTNELPINDIVIDAIDDYQKPEERLATPEKKINDYSEEQGGVIQKWTRIFSALTRGNSANVDEEIQEVSFKDPLMNFGKLCNGEILLAADIQKKLKCQYVDHGIPFLKIAPFKEEEFYLDPRIVVYHEVIYDEEIEVIKRLSEPMLQSAEVQDPYTGKLKQTQFRIGKTAWLEADEDSHIELLNRRVEHMTSLTTETAENLQIAYYETGGFFKPHCDFISREDMFYFHKFGTKNRIATVLFYMNDVEKGGGTVFPLLNVTIWPKKGSALFWYNIKRNGQENEFTYHGGCTVLSGTKWIATKWLHEKGQELLRPCSLLKNE